MGERIFLYCERGLAGGLWAEPFNALSNAAFVLIALLVRHHLTMDEHLNRSARHVVQALCLVTGSVGVGSTAFHTLATRGSQVLDVVPIGLFIVSALWCTARWIAKASPSRAALMVVIFALATALAVLAMSALSCRPDVSQPGQLWPCMNGSWPYLPTFGTLLLCAGMARAACPPAASWLARAAGVFGVALLARSLDLSACGLHLPVSLHTLWHLGAATTSYAVLRALIAAAPRHQDRYALKRDA